MTLPEDMVAAFWSKVDRRAPDECWPWLGEKAKDRRGQFRIQKGGKKHNAPRISLLVAGRIPASESLFACHACDNPNCVNPDHLWWGTKSENQLDASKKKRWPGTEKTHCLRGHPLSGDNLRMHLGWRSCRECDRIRRREAHRRQKAARETEGSSQ